MIEEKIIGWHHWLDGHEFEQALGVGDGQGSLGCCSPWGHKESDMTEQLYNKGQEISLKLPIQDVGLELGAWSSVLGTSREHFCWHMRTTVGH